VIDVHQIARQIARRVERLILGDAEGK